jgi:polysaccharide export outer membrane protein
MKKAIVCSLWSLAITAVLAAGAARAQVPEPTAATPAAPAAVRDAEDYVIGPGDELQVFVWRNPELSVTVPVRPDGKISTPLVENMVAIGKTPSQLARDIETVLAEFVRTPQVNIIVGNAVSTFSQVKVVGQVREPQALPYREGLKVLDVVLATGGLTDFAAPNRAKIVRTENGRNREIRVKLGNLMNKGDLSQNFELKPGDVFLIPQAVF